MRFKECTAKQFVEFIERFGVWFAEGISFDHPYRDEWELNKVELRPFDNPYVGKEYLVYVWNGHIDDYPGEQTFFMLAGEYNNSMDGFPYHEGYCPVAHMIHVGYRNERTPVYMGVWEDVEYYIPTLEDEPDWIIE